MYLSRLYLSMYSTYLIAFINKLHFNIAKCYKHYYCSELFLIKRLFIPFINIYYYLGIGEHYIIVEGGEGGGEEQI